MRSRIVEGQRGLTGRHGHEDGAELDVEVSGVFKDGLLVRDGERVVVPAAQDDDVTAGLVIR